MRCFWGTIQSRSSADALLQTMCPISIYRVACMVQAPPAPTCCLWKSMHHSPLAEVQRKLGGVSSVRTYDWRLGPAEAAAVRPLFASPPGWADVIVASRQSCAAGMRAGSQPQTGDRQAMEERSKWPMERAGNQISPSRRKTRLLGSLPSRLYISHSSDPSTIESRSRSFTSF